MATKFENGLLKLNYIFVANRRVKAIALDAGYNKMENQTGNA